LKDEFNLDIEIKGDTKEVNFPKHQNPKEIIDNLMLQEQVLMGLFYGLNLKLKDISSLKIEDMKLKKDTLYIKKQQYHLYPELRESLSKLLNSTKGEYLFEQNGQNLTISKIRATLQNITKKIDIPQKDFRDSFKNLYKISQPKPQKIASSF
jgi:site-specific recombinase XerC